ncbi:hypothetical protein NPIL_192471 [Nephila pilipes]|uniref:Uncharacterized protein n=1 Tax=Nephila pilipes TaxID=299642 RepID=A0A8X6UD29_NEPPI|nr:hypothetical protein NPIL_192471 [Nephila pilipes]
MGLTFDTNKILYANLLGGKLEAFLIAQIHFNNTGERNYAPTQPQMNVISNNKNGRIWRDIVSVGVMSKRPGYLPVPGVGPVL